MKKLIYLLWERNSLSPAERGRLLLEDCAPRILELGVQGLQMNICDEHVDTPSPAPKPIGSEPFIAQIHLWLEDEQQRWPVQDLLRQAGFELQGYEVDPWLYTDYGENEHAQPRDWPDGQRSPGVIALTLLHRPKRVNKQKWMQRWFGHQSPMSEWMQPRARYCRNVVLDSVTPGTPHCDGIVEETWPSREHVTNLKLFYGAKNWCQVAMHMAIMLKSVTAILNLWNITTVMTSEYFLRTPPETSAD